MEWTQLLKDLTDAVQVRNTKVAALRNAGAHVTDLAAQAIAAGAPGPALAKILATMEPTIAHDRPHVCGQSPVVPPLRPAAVPKQSTETLPDDAGGIRPVRYSLAEAFEEGILPWQPATTRTYMRRRSPERGIPVPAGELDGQTTRYTKDELTTWLSAWQQQAGPANGGRPTGLRARVSSAVEPGPIASEGGHSIRSCH
ncbi:hypothetical protein ACIGW8_31745 [Streptomyces sioyaensis]|uniref:hypothetical protein n=1 Tax=Streptomyces sioyaensis TaxID=67364 RepID=UPI0037CD84FF